MKLRIKAIAATVGVAGALTLGTLPAHAAPAAPSESQLVGKLTLLLSDASADRKAAELEGGAAALGTVDGVAGRVRTAGPAFKWTILGPVRVDGDVATATLRREFPGLPLYTDPLSWKWMGGNWKLTNASACFLASQTMTPCTV